MAFWGLGQIAGGVPGGKAQNFWFFLSLRQLGLRNYITHNQPAFPG